MIRDDQEKALSGAFLKPQKQSKNVEKYVKFAKKCEKVAENVDFRGRKAYN